MDQLMPQHILSRSGIEENGHIKMEGHCCCRMKSLVERGFKSEGKLVITLSQTAFQTNWTSAVQRAS